MSLDFGRVKYIDQRTKNIVNCYLRESQQLLFNHPVIIPDIILHICLLFYDRDAWSKHIGSQLEIDPDDANIVKYKDEPYSHSYNSAFLSRICDPHTKSIYHWRFKVISLSNVWNLIGIWKICNEKLPTDTYFTKGNHKGYALNITRGRLVVLVSGGKSRGDYCCMAESNDIIDMYLDCVRCELRYVINGKNYGKAFDIDTEYKYRAAICLQSPVGSIQII